MKGTIGNMKIIKEQVLTEMAMSRPDAMEKCEALGMKFIEHFVKIYNSPQSETVHHWSKEMQAWYDSISRIKIKNTNKFLTIPEKIDWFYSFTSSYEDYFNNDVDKIYKYNQLITGVELTNDVYATIIDIFDLAGGNNN